MSIKKADEFFEQLDPGQKQFLLDKEINATYSIRKWIGFLSKAAAYDTYADKAIIKLRDRKVWLILGLVVTVIASIFIFYLLPIPLLLAFLLYKTLEAQKKFKGRDLNNYLRGFFFPVLEVLKDKAGENTKLSASLNFNDPRKGKAQHSTQAGRKVAQYEATYILTKVILKDDAALEFVIGDLLKDLNWSKRSASGKTKFKSKSKVAHLCIIKLSVPKSKYSIQVPDIPEDVAVEEKGDLLILKKKIKIKRVGKDHVMSPKALFDGLQSLYALLLDPGNDGDRMNLSNEQREDFSDEAMIATVWSGGYFDDYDYDSFDYTDTSYGAYDDGAESIFDS